MVSDRGLDMEPDDASYVRVTPETIGRVCGRLDTGYYIVPAGEPTLRLNDEDSSRIIEALILRLPLPVVYLVERSDGRSLVLSADVDAVHRFVGNGFALRGLRGRRAHLNGRRWNDLAPKVQQRVMDTYVVMADIRHPCREAVALDILQRSQDRLFLHRQAVRHMMHPGAAIAWIRAAAAFDVFLHATRRRFSSDSLDDCEAVLRFCACFLHGVDAYIDANGDIDAFLGATLDLMNRDDLDVRDDLTRAFRRSMQNAILVFGDQDVHWGRHARETEMALFEVVAIVLAPLAEDFVRSQRAALRAAFDGLMRTPAFVQAITNDPQHPDNVRTRFRLAIETYRAVVAAADVSGGIAFDRMVGRPAVQKERLRAGYGQAHGVRIAK